MEKLEHPLLIVDLVNRLAAMIAAALGIPVADPTEIVPDYLVMCAVVVVIILALGLFLRSRLSVENPGKTQIVMEDLISYLIGMLKEQGQFDATAFNAALDKIDLEDGVKDGRVTPERDRPAARPPPPPPVQAPIPRRKQ